MIGDLLHGQDLHSDMEPVYNVGRRLRHGAGKPLQDVGAVRNHRHIAEAAISYFLESMKSAIADCMLLSAAGDEIAAIGFTSSTAAASRHNELETSRRIGLGAANVGRVDADDKLFAPIARKLHFQLVSFIHLSPGTPYFLDGLVVEALPDLDGALAHGRVHLGRFNRQKIGKHLRCLPIWHRAPQPRRQLHQLWRRSIGTNFLQRREGSNHARIAISTQHPARIAHLYGAEHSSEPAGRVILDWPERMAIRADSTKETKSLRLVGDDRALQRREYLFAVIDREANFSVEQAFPAFVDTNFFPAAVAELVLPLNRNRPFHRHYRLLE